MLDVLAGVAQQHVPLPQIAAEHDDLILRPERGCQQSIAMQALNPLAIEHIGLGPARDLPGLPRIHQEHLEAAAFEEFEQRDPVDAC